MKKTALFGIVFCFLFGLIANGQPSVVFQEDFEQSLPSGWTVSANGTSTVTWYGGHGLAAPGTGCLRIEPVRAQDVSIVSPVINVSDAETRLEFNHIPMLSRDAHAEVWIIVNGVETRLQRQGQNGVPECYDATYGAGTSSFTNYFIRNLYWTDETMSEMPALSDLDNSYWKHEVFYLKSKLGNATSFQLKFQISVATNVTNLQEYRGWFIDDVKVYSASAPNVEVRIPKVENVKSPFTEYELNYYPNCGNAEVTFRIEDLNGSMPVADSIYAEYYTSEDSTVRRVILSSMGDRLFSGFIPFSGLDVTTYWRAVVNDGQGNKTTFPYTGVYSAFKSIMPYVGNDPLATTGLSSQEVALKSNVKLAKYQMRYSAQELRDAGYTAGKINGLYFNITNAATGARLTDFSMYIANVNPAVPSSDFNQYGGAMSYVFAAAPYVIGGTGWTFFQFSEEFVWDGISDIMIKTCYGELATTYGATKLESVPASGKYATRRYESATSSMTSACFTGFNITNPTLNYKPNIRLNFVNMCHFPFDAGLTDTVISPQYANDCGNRLSHTLITSTSNPQPLKVHLRNDGTDQMRTVKIKWMLDNNLSTLDSAIWTGVMRPVRDTVIEGNEYFIPVDTNIEVTLTNNFNPPAGIYQLSVWTEMRITQPRYEIAPDQYDPSLYELVSREINQLGDSVYIVRNDTMDWNHFNDTIKYKLVVTNGNLSGNYAIGGNVSGIDRTKTFDNFEDAFLYMTSAGIGDTATFHVVGHQMPYTGHYKLPSCLDISDGKLLVFKGERNDTLEENLQLPLFYCYDEQPYLWNLSATSHVKFEDINFQANANNTDVIFLNGNSKDITFENCTFGQVVELSDTLDFSPYSMPNTIINIGAANDVTVNNCKFVTPAQRQIVIQGISQINRSKNIKITNSDFGMFVYEGMLNNTTMYSNVMDNCITAAYTDSLVVDTNTFKTKLEHGTRLLDSQWSEETTSNLDGAKYVLLLNDVSKSSVSANNFVLNNVSAINLATVNTTDIANNRISVNYNTNRNNAAYSCHGVYLLSGDTNNIVYNNIKVSASEVSQKKGYGMTLGTGTGSVANKVINNILVSEGYGLAVAVKTSTTVPDSSFDFMSNVYYKNVALDSIPLFSLNTMNNISDTVMWRNRSGDSLSYYDQDPILDQNLRPGSTFLCEKGSHLPAFMKDCYGNLRPEPSEKQPCIGAVEFNPPPSNIYVTKVGVMSGNFDGNNTYSDCNFGVDSVYIQFKNISSDVISENSSVYLGYSVNGVPSASHIYGRQIVPDTLYTYVFPETYDFSASSVDLRFDIKGWTYFTVDTVRNNDTASATIWSLFQLPRLADASMNVNYGDSANVTVNSSDSVYWYYSLNDEQSFYRGLTLKTSRLYSDTSYYYSRHTEIPLVKITEVQLSKNASRAGQTVDLPSYVTKDQAFEISNFGNGDKDMSGHKFMYYKTANNNRDTMAVSPSATYRFPNGYILPAHSSVVLIPVASLNVAQDIALPIGTSFNPSMTTKSGFILADSSNTIYDAVALNNAIFDNSLHVPNTVWRHTSNENVLTSANVGVIRADVTSRDASGWIIADADNVMTMGQYNDELTEYVNNGCYGEKSKYVINVSGVPAKDPGICDMWIEGITATEVCTLGDEYVSVKITNTGDSVIEAGLLVKCDLFENGAIVNTVQSNYPNTIGANDTVLFTLTSPLDLSAHTDARNLTLRAYTSYSSDIININDTAYYSITSLKTPLPPTVTNDSVLYGTSATLSATAGGSNIVAWYDNSDSEQELARGAYVTPLLYAQDTFYASSLLLNAGDILLGNGTAANGTTAYPCPFNTSKQKVKEQYIISADSLSALGFSQGNINSVSFYVSKVTTSGSVQIDTLHDYSLKLGTTTDTSFTNVTGWLDDLTEVYSENELRFEKTFVGWKKLEFDNPFYWDGQSNIVMEICFTARTASHKIQTYYTRTGYKSTRSYRHATNDACSWTGNPTSDYYQLPNMKFEISLEGCASEKVPVVVKVSPAPVCDVAILAITSPADVSITSRINTPIEVVLRNYGTQTLTETDIVYNINGVSNTYHWTGSLDKDSSEAVTLCQYQFDPGRIDLEVIASLDCDQTHTNDTIRAEYSACLGSINGITEFVIGSSQQANYSSFSEAIEDLQTSGICGPVVFLVEDGNYEEQIYFPDILGISDINTVTFKAAEGASPEVTFIAESTDENKSTLILESAANITFDGIIFSSNSAAIPTLATLNNTNNVTFKNSVFSAPENNNPNIVLFSLTGLNNNIEFISDRFNNGKIGLQTAVLKGDSASANLTVDSCSFIGFSQIGATINKYQNIVFTHNTINSSSEKSTFGVELNKIGGQMCAINSNHIYLGACKVKCFALSFKDAYFEDMNPLNLYNNEISMIGNTNNIDFYGINLSNTSYINVYYNTVYIRAGNNNTKTRNINIETSSNIVVRNSIFENQSKGFAYYVNGANLVTLSNNNNYFTNGTRLAYLGTNVNDLAALRTLGGMDNRSISVANPFFRDDLLKLLRPNESVRAAEPLEEVTVDIVNTARPISPKPTMGAYEYEFKNEDVGITEIIEPVTSVRYIENDPITVSVVLQNFGSYSVTQVPICVDVKYRDDDEEVAQSFCTTWNGFLTSLDTAVITLTGNILPPLNTPRTDSLYIRVYTSMENDGDSTNDYMTKHIFTIPAYNLKVVKTDNITQRCKLFNQTVSAVIKNEGNKDITSAQPDVHIWYEVIGETGGLLKRVEETFRFPFVDSEGNTLQTLPMNTQMTYVFDEHVDLYPLGSNDTTWRIRTYISLEPDHVLDGDTSAYISVNARVSPAAPVAFHDTIDYATWGHPYASQIDRLGIKWFTDSTVSSSQFYSSAKNKDTSMYTTPQLFANDTFYVRVNLDGNSVAACESFYTPIYVVVGGKKPIDMCATAIELPTKGYAFMQADTVAMSVTNYGTLPQSNFQVSYQIKPTGNQAGGVAPTVVTETCTATVQPDETYTYVFTTLGDFSQYTSYEVIGWVKASGDIVEVNDTTHVAKKINPIRSSGSHTVTDGSSLDIVEVQLSTLSNYTMAFSDTYNDYSESVEPAVLFQGLSDSLYVLTGLASGQQVDEYSTVSGWMKAYIDWNRDGNLTASEEVYSDTVIPGVMNRGLITVPSNALTGYMRMRIIVSQNDSKHTFGPNPGSSAAEPAIAGGEIEDYKVYVRPAEQNNAELVRFESPERFVSVQQQQVKVRLRNAGLQNLTSATITWSHNGGEEQVYNWTGSLASSESEIVTLGNVQMPLGENILTARVSVAGDSYTANDVANLNAYVFDTHVLSWGTDFEEIGDNGGFYKYEIDPSNPTNIWEFGQPNTNGNTNIRAAASGVNCWKTSLDGPYTKNNSSILYTPVFDITLIKPDTMTFMLYNWLGDGASMTVEYKNYRGEWSKLGYANDAQAQNWYDSDNGFTKAGRSPNWKKVVYSLDSITNNFGIEVQFRFVFKSGNSNNVTDGIAIDDFRIDRGKRDQDAGAVAIDLMPTSLPNYGQTFFPKVKIANYGKKDLTSYEVCYITQDMHIPICEEVYGEQYLIAPGDTGEYTFINGHYLSSEMPDPFTIIAYTHLNPTDIYYENDTATARIVIGPLNKDAAVMEITEPTGTMIAANDDLTIAIRVKNYGLEPITTLPVGYSVSGGEPVNEVIDFVLPLNSGDECVYRFRTPYHVPFGTINLKTWVGLPGDYYSDNDTLYKRIEASNYARDLEAKFITVDDGDASTIGVQLAFLNKSSVGIGNIRVGYYYDGNINNKVEETYYANNIVPAGTYAYHMFTQRLPRRVYNSICAYVIYDQDDDHTNDTTCTLYMGYRDGVADSLLIQENLDPTCKIQLLAHNGGTIGGRTTVRGTLIVNGDWSNPIVENFTWEYDEPNPNRRQELNFNYRVPKSTDGTYNIIAWIDYPYDAARWNDTVRVAKVRRWVGLEQQAENAMDFSVEQNTPNPYTDNTKIYFTLPYSGKIKFYVSDIAGHIIYTHTDNYAQGRNHIDFDGRRLNPGVYYYIVEFNDQRKMKKMVVVK